jgi:hypothetical protein
LMGQGNLAQSFQVKLVGNSPYGDKGDHVLELTPRQPTARYKKLWLVVDPVEFRVKESVVLEPSDNVNRFTFSNANTEKPVKARWFQVSSASLRKMGYSRMNSAASPTRGSGAPTTPSP